MTLRHSLPRLPALATAGGLAALLLFAPASALYAADPPPSVALDGAVKHAQSFDVAALQKLPAEHVSFQTERGTTQASFTGARLWAVLEAAGGLVDDAKGAAFHHVLKVTAKDGYFVVLSTGEIAPNFGGKPAIIAYQRGQEAPGASGLRLVLPGDKFGGRDVRDIVTIHVD